MWLYFTVGLALEQGPKTVTMKVLVLLTLPELEVSVELRQEVRVNKYSTEYTVPVAKVLIKLKFPGPTERQRENMGEEIMLKNVPINLRGAGLVGRPSSCKLGLPYYLHGCKVHLHALIHVLSCINVLLSQLPPSLCSKYLSLLLPP